MFILFFTFLQLKKRLKSNSLLTVWSALSLSQQSTVSQNYSQSIKINLGPSYGGKMVPSFVNPSFHCIIQWCRNRGGQGATGPPQYLADNLTLFQPWGADSAHSLLVAPPMFFTFRHHWLYWRLTGFYFLLSALLKWLKLAYGQIKHIKMHCTLVLYPVKPERNQMYQC